MGYMGSCSKGSPTLLQTELYVCHSSIIQFAYVLSVHGHLDGFRVLAIVNNASMRVQISLQDSAF